MKCNKCLGVLIFVPLIINAQELEPNGNFDSDITGWHCGSVAPTWINNDGANLSGAGSLQHTVTAINANSGSLGGGYCNFSSATAGKNYIFKGSYKLLSADEVENLVLQVFFYTQNENYIDVFTDIIPVSTITLNQWTSFTVTASAPANTGNIISHVNYEFTTTGNPINWVIRWDDMSLKQEKSVIFMNGFE